MDNRDRIPFGVSYTCPHCGGPIAELGERCPHCHQELDDLPAFTYRAPPNRVVRVIAIVIVVLIVVASFAMLGLAMDSCRTPSAVQ
jgi:hypothetical protein